MHYTVSEFMSELANLIDSGLIGLHYIICGDLSYPGPAGTRGLVGAELSELINSHNLTQHVYEPTSRIYLITLSHRLTRP